MLCFLCQIPDLDMLDCRAMAAQDILADTNSSRTIAFTK